MNCIPRAPGDDDFVKCVVPVPMNTSKSTSILPQYVQLGKFASVGEDDPVLPDHEERIMRIRWVAAETCEKDVTDEELQNTEFGVPVV